MEMNIVFKPGYYEWHLILNDEIIYVFDDFIDDFAEDPEVTEEVACDEADQLMWQVRETYENREFREDYLEHFDEVSDEDFEKIFVKATEVITNEILRRWG